jgi:hypothetical protein
LIGATTRIICVGTVKRPCDWKYRLEERQLISFGGALVAPGYRIEGICGKTNRSIFEIYGSEVGDIGLLM